MPGIEFYSLFFRMASFILLCYSFLEKATSHQTSIYGYHFPQDDPHGQVFHTLHHGSKTNIVLPISTMAGSAEHNSHIHNKKKQQSFRSQMLEAIVI